MAPNGRVAIFGPHPLLSITVESLTAEGGDDIHVHAAGQGVWVARMAAELGARPVLCGFLGGETGTALRPLLEQLPVELRLVETAAASGCYIHDRRGGKREPVAQSASMPPSRHEIDDLFSTTCAVALDSDVLALCGPYPSEALPLEIYGNLVTDVRANGTPVVVDLSSPMLDSALEGKPDLVKINDWELAKFVVGPVDTEAGMRTAALRLLERGAGAAIITRAEEPALGDGQRHLVVHQQRLEVRVAVVLAGPVMLVVDGFAAVVVLGREVLEPLPDVAVQAALVVVDEDARRDVHRADAPQPVLDAALVDDPLHRGRQMDELALLLGVERQVLGVGLQGFPPFGRSPSTSGVDFVAAHRFIAPGL